MRINVLFPMIELLEIHALFLNVDALRRNRISVIALVYSDAVAVGFGSQASGLDPGVLHRDGISFEIILHWVLERGWAMSICRGLQNWGQRVSSLGFDGAVVDVLAH